MFIFLLVWQLVSYNDRAVYQAEAHGFKPPARPLVLEIREKQEKRCPDSDGPLRQKQS